MIVANIERIAVGDDEPGVVEMLAETVVDLGLTPVKLSKPLATTLSRVAKDVSSSADALLIDNFLKKHNYSKFNGVEVVAHLYASRFPVVLCTSQMSSIAEFRHLLRRVPAVLETKRLGSDLINEALTLCVEEFKGHFTPKRRPWRTLLRVDSVDTTSGWVHVVLPSWDPSRKISLRSEFLAPKVQGALEPGFRTFVYSNLGAEDELELYVSDWGASRDGES